MNSHTFALVLFFSIALMCGKGVDLLTAGVMGGFMSGVFTAVAVSKRVAWDHLGPLLQKA